MQRLEARVTFQRIAALRAILAEGRSERGAMCEIMRAESHRTTRGRCACDRGSLLPVDEGKRLQRRHVLRDAGCRNGCGDARRSEHAGAICVQRIAEQPRRRRIGREVIGVSRKQRVRRAQRQRICAAKARRRAERLCAGESADAAVARGAQAVKLRGKPPDRRAVGDIGSGEAAVRRDGERRFAVAYLQPVIADPVHRVGPQITVSMFVQPDVLRIALFEHDARMAGSI